MAKSGSSGIPITNESQLLGLMEQIVNQVIENVSFKITLILQKRIREDVYGSHPSNKYYYAGSKKPTMEFLSAWDWTKIRKENNRIVREMFYDYSKMRNDPDTWLHGSNIPGWPQDARPLLPDFLNKSGLSSSLWISVNHEPFWDNFIEELYSRKKLDQMFDMEFRKFKIYRR